MATDFCPSPETLRQFMLGVLPPQRVEQIVWHLQWSSTCVCHRVLASLEGESDGLLQLLATDARHTDYEQEPQCVALVAAAARQAWPHPPASDPFGLLPAVLRDAKRFQDLRFLGRGGMGEVYCAYDKDLARPVALKVIRQDRFCDASSVARFRAEAETAARLDHPHIVPIYEINRDRDLDYIVMKWIDGQPLSQLAEQTRSDMPAATRCVAAIARAIHFAHQRQVLHRDLKPANILLAGDHHAYVADFGLAKRLDADAHLTQTGTLLGTPSYMAPEQVAGSACGITTATDVYGLGGILYFALTGRPPFEGHQPLAVLRAVIDVPPSPPSSCNPRVDADLDTICLKCLAKDPAERYGSAEALAEDLERWERGETVLARPAPWRRRLLRWCRRKPLAATLTIIASLLCLVIAVGSLGAAIAIHRHAIETKRSLFASQIALARAERFNQRPDHRRTCWHAVLGALEAAAAFALQPEQRLAARNEAIAALAFPHVQREKIQRCDSPYPAVSPAFQHFASANQNGEVVIRRVSDGVETARLTLPSQWISELYLHPAGDRLAATYWTGSGYLLAVHTLGDGRVAWNRAIDSSTASVRFAPSGDRLAAAPTKGQLHVLDVATGQLLLAIDGPSQVELQGDWHPTGGDLAVADGTSSVRSFDGATGALAASYDLPEPIRVVRWGPGGSLLAAVGWSNVHLFNTQQRQVVRTFRGQAPGPVIDISWAPDGRLIAYGTHDRVTRVWHATTGQVLAEIPGRFPQFSATENRLAVVGSHHAHHAITVWRIAPAQELRTLHMSQPGSNPLECISPSRDGKLLAATDGENLRLWKTGTLEQICQTSLPGAFGLSALSATEGWLVHSRRGPLVVGRAGSLASATSIQEALWSEASIARFCQLAASRDGRRLAVAGRPGRFLLIDRAAERWHEITTGHNEVPLAVSPDGELAISTFDRQTYNEVWAWSFTSGKQIAKIGDGGRGYVKLRFSPDGRRLVCGSSLHYRCWSRNADDHWQRCYTIPRQLLGMWGACAFSPDARILAVADTQQVVKLCHAATGQPLCVLQSPGLQPNIIDLCFSPDGQTLFVAGDNQLLQAWDLARLLQRLDPLGLAW